MKKEKMNIIRDKIKELELNCIEAKNQYDTCKSKVEKNGKHYINLVVDTKKETDQYGNTHTVYVSQSKEQRAAIPNRHRP